MAWTLLEPPQSPKKVNQRSLVSTHSQNYPLKSPATLSPPLFLCIVFFTILLMSPSDTESHPSTVLAPEVEFHTHQIQGKTTPLHETLPNWAKSPPSDGETEDKEGGPCSTKSRTHWSEVNNPSPLSLEHETLNILSQIPALRFRSRLTGPARRDSERTDRRVRTTPTKSLDSPSPLDTTTWTSLTWHGSSNLQRLRKIVLRHWSRDEACRPQAPEAISRPPWRRCYGYFPSIRCLAQIAVGSS